MATVLVIEDDPLIALDLSQIIAEATGADVIVAISVAAAEQQLARGVDFALLDVNVCDETTFALARRLVHQGVSCAFASGASRAIIPDDLKALPFLAKPCRAPLVISAVRAALLTSKTRACQ
jgi:DNA-binding LytR/AlgR family response regulator